MLGFFWFGKKHLKGSRLQNLDRSRMDESYWIQNLYIEEKTMTSSKLNQLTVLRYFDMRPSGRKQNLKPA